MSDHDKAEKRGLKWTLGTIGVVVGILVGLSTLVKTWKDIFPGAPGPKAGLIVYVDPSTLEMAPKSRAPATWQLIETNNVGIDLRDRTGTWRTTDGTAVKVIGPQETVWRIEPLKRRLWNDLIYLPADAAAQSTDGFLVLDQGFRGRDDNGNEVVGSARIRVRIAE